MSQSWEEVTPNNLTTQGLFSIIFHPVLVSVTGIPVCVSNECINRLLDTPALSTTSSQTLTGTPAFQTVVGSARFKRKFQTAGGDRGAAGTHCATPFQTPVGHPSDDTLRHTFLGPSLQAPRQGSGGFICGSRKTAHADLDFISTKNLRKHLDNSIMLW